MDTEGRQEADEGDPALLIRERVSESAPYQPDYSLSKLEGHHVDSRHLWELEVLRQEAFEEQSRRAENELVAVYNTSQLEISTSGVLAG